MPTYQFVCDAGHEREFVFSMASKPATLPCEECGKPSVSRITGGLMAVIKNEPIKYDHKYTIPNMGRFVRSDQEQHRMYSEHIRNAKKDAAERRRSLAKKADEHCEHVASVPLEVHEYVSEMTGDKQAFQKDPVYWAKKTGTYLGED